MSPRTTAKPTPLGEFEHLVLLTTLRLDGQAYAIDLRREIEQEAHRKVTRGALYTTLERLQNKGLVDWTVEDSTPERGGLPRRRFRVTDSGLAALRASRDTLLRLWRGVEDLLEGRP